MSRIEKLLNKFRDDPERVRYADLEKLLVHLGCEKVPAKGSHVKFKHRVLHVDIIIPVHNNECKPFYKKQARTQIINLFPST